MDPKAQNDETGSVSFDPTDSAICVVSPITTTYDAISELRNEVSDMKKELDELKTNMVPEQQRRLQGVMRELDFLKDDAYDDNEEYDDDPSENDDLPILTLENTEYDDSDFDRRIEELSDFMESIGYTGDGDIHINPNDFEISDE